MPEASPIDLQHECGRPRANDRDDHRAETVGTTCQLDLFVGYQGAGRTQQFSAAGLTTVVDSLDYPVSGLAVGSQLMFDSSSFPTRRAQSSK
jgi:hypothetical protein